MSSHQLNNPLLERRPDEDVAEKLARLVQRVACLRVGGPIISANARSRR